ncbi:MAG: hypothetical protein AABW50_05855 [Nanoarchaeota archaeon]
MQERDNVLRILEESLEALKKEDSIALKELSNQTIHTASVAQDPDNIAIAVIVYSLSKIIERKSNYMTKPGWEKFYKNIIYGIEHSVESLKKEDDQHLKKHIEDLRTRIEGVSGRLRRYIQEVFSKASINKASRIYEHGISMEKTAKLLGISMWELASYAGQTGISDVPLGRTMSTKDRIKLAMEFFK